MLDHEGNIWVAGMMRPQSKYVKKYVSRKEELEIAKSKKKKIISQRVQDSQTRYVLEYKASISFDYILTSLQ